jgi:hypothetical protein
MLLAASLYFPVLHRGVVLEILQIGLELKRLAVCSNGFLIATEHVEDVAACSFGRYLTGLQAHRKGNSCGSACVPHLTPVTEEYREVRICGGT